MGIAINGKNTKIAINGKQYIGAAINGKKVYENPSPPKTYIAEGTSTTNALLNIFNNNNGVKGNLIVTIAGNDWTTLSQYAPDIGIALDFVCYQWLTGIGVPLNFAKLKSAGNHFMSSNRVFNQPISFPMLESVGGGSTLVSGFMGNCHAFNQNIHFEKLVNIDGNFMANLYGMNQKNISFGSFVWPGGATASRNLLVVDSINYNFITIIFNKQQTRTAVLPSGVSMIFRNRTTDTQTHDRVNLRIRQGSAAVSVSAKTWAGHTFASVTLIDEHGNAV